MNPLAQASLKCSELKPLAKGRISISEGVVSCKITCKFATFNEMNKYGYYFFCLFVVVVVFFLFCFFCVYLLGVLR